MVNEQLGTQSCSISAAHGNSALPASVSIWFEFKIPSSAAPSASLTYSPKCVIIISSILVLF